MSWSEQCRLASHCKPSWRPGYRQAARGASSSNMIVLTDSRRYVFMLDPYGQTSFLIRFNYPPSVVQPAGAPRRMPEAYKFRGDRSLFPAPCEMTGRRPSFHGPANRAAGDVRDEWREARATRQRQDDRRRFRDRRDRPRFKFRLGDAEATATRQIPKPFAMNIQTRIRDTGPAEQVRCPWSASAATAVPGTSDCVSALSPQSCCSCTWTLSAGLPGQPQAQTCRP